MAKKAPKKKPVLAKEVELPEQKNTISITETELPEIKEWKIGEEYEISIKIKQTGMRIEDWGKNKGKVVAQFEIIEMESEDEDDEKENEKEEEDSEGYKKGGKIKKSNTSKKDDKKKIIGQYDMM